MYDNEDDKRVKWDCFSCGKHLGEQGHGGSFTLEFGYGSGNDMTEGINGWICDECVAQKHGRLRVSTLVQARQSVFENLVPPGNDPRRDYWNEECQQPLAEHERTRRGIADLDFFGRKKIPGWSTKHEFEGWRDYESITAEERSQIEASLFTDVAVAPVLIVKLLRALMESESRRAEEVLQRRNAELIAHDRAWNQAQKLSPEELAELRAREGQERLSPEAIQRLWENVAYHEREYEEYDEIDRLRERVKELEAAVVTHAAEDSK